MRIARSLLFTAIMALGGSVVLGQKTCALTPPDDKELAAALFGGKVFSYEDNIAPNRTGERVAYVVRTPTKLLHPRYSRRSHRYLINDVPIDVVGNRIVITEVASGHRVEPGPRGANTWRPSWSPSGNQLAYYCDAAGPPQLWLYDVATGKSRRLSTLTVAAALWRGDEAVWSPDGRRIYLPLRAPLTEKPKIPSSGLNDASQLEGKPSRVRVFLTGAEKGEKKPERPDADLAGQMRREQESILACFDLRTNRMHRLVSPSAALAPSVLRLSASGRFVSFLTVTHPASVGGPYVFDLAVVGGEGGAPTLVARDLPVSDDPEGEFFEGIYAWSPSRDQLAFVKEGALWCWSPGQKVAERVDLSCGKLTRTPLAFTADGSSLMVGLAPEANTGYVTQMSRALALISLRGRHVVYLRPTEPAEVRRALQARDGVLWQPDSGQATVLWRSSETRETLATRYDCASGKPSLLRRERGAFDLRFAGRSKDAIFGLHEDIETPRDVFRFGSDLRRQRRITHIEPRFDRFRSGPYTLLHTETTFAGKPVSLKSVVFAPPGAQPGQKFPTIVSLYGGVEMSVALERFGGLRPGGISTALFNRRGYAVLFVDTPLSPAGKDARPLEEMTAAVTAQVSNACKVSWCDPNRLSLLGQSFGAYCAVGIATSTDRFRATVAMDGIYDLPGCYSWMFPDGRGLPFAWFESRYNRMAGPPWAELPRYIQNSPYYRMDKLAGALLLIHGEEDDGCPVEEARKLFRAAVRLEKTAQLATYRGEGHSLMYWSAPNAIDAYERIISFTDRYVKK